MLLDEEISVCFVSVHAFLLHHFCPPGQSAQDGRPRYRAPITAEMIREIAVPVLVAVGDQDVIGGGADELARLIPGARAYTIPGKDHNRAVGDRSFKAEALAFFES